MELEDREEERKIAHLIPWLACGSWWLRKKKDGVGEEGRKQSAQSPGMGAERPETVLTDPALSGPLYIRSVFRPWE